MYRRCYNWKGNVGWERMPNAFFTPYSLKLLKTTVKTKLHMFNKFIISWDVICSHVTLAKVINKIICGDASGLRYSRQLQYFSMFS